MLKLNFFFSFLGETCGAEHMVVVWEDGDSDDDDEERITHMRHTSHANFGPSNEVLEKVAARARPDNACVPLNNNLSGKIALVVRTDECDFLTQVRNAQAANADAVIILNNGEDMVDVMPCQDLPDEVGTPCHKIISIIF